MQNRQHWYNVEVEWTGNTGSGTIAYNSYSRSFEVRSPGAPLVVGSSAPEFLGDAARWNPEQMLVAALSSCHMLWYLHLCAEAGINVLRYRDQPEGIMRETFDGSGAFTRVLLQPRVLCASGSDPFLARKLHDKAHEKCFIAKSVNFTVACEPLVEVE